MDYNEVRGFYNKIIIVYERIPPFLTGNSKINKQLTVRGIHNCARRDVFPPYIRDRKGESKSLFTMLYRISLLTILPKDGVLRCYTTIASLCQYSVSKSKTGRMWLFHVFLYKILQLKMHTFQVIDLITLT